MAKRSKFQIRSEAARQRWHVRDDQKEAYWRGHIEAWRGSGLSKRSYCEQKKVAYSSFMSWQREIELRDREKAPAAHLATSMSTLCESGANPFVPIRILPDSTPEGNDQSEPERGSSARRQIEIALPGGAVIRLHDDCDPSFVAKLLSQMKV